MGATPTMNRSAKDEWTRCTHAEPETCVGARSRAPIAGKIDLRGNDGGRPFWAVCLTNSPTAVGHHFWNARLSAIFKRRVRFALYGRNRKRRLLSHGLRRSKSSRTKRIYPAWR